MRKIRILTYVFISFIMFSIVGCNEDGTNEDIIAEGQIEFSATLIESTIKSKQATSELSDVRSAIVTIENELGITVYNSEKVSFYKFNDVYLTEPLDLLTGSYNLTGFYLTDESDSVLYVAPLESSDMAYLVENPLPISFNIYEDEVTTIYPEVLSTNGYNPEDFGYASFGINQVEIFDFLLTVFKYNSTSENFELTDADLLITGSSDTLYLNSLAAVTNKITVNAGYENYTITITKPGHNSFIKDFTIDSLKNHYANPLTVILETIDTEEGIIAYYSFNGDTYDYSGYENHATNYGAVLTSDRFGNANSAYSFDGLTSYMKLTNTLNASDGLTFSFWINCKGLQDGENNGTVICKYNMAYDYHCFSVSTFQWSDNPGLRGNYYASQYDTDYRDCAWSNMMDEDDIPSQWDASKFDLVNPMQLPLNEWVYCVINVTDTEVEAWVNGVLTVKKEREYATYYNSDYEPTYIGNNLLGGEGDNNHFYGLLDDLKVYNRPLTEDEILTLYHEGGWDE